MWSGGSVVPLIEMAPFGNDRSVIDVAGSMIAVIQSTANSTSKLAMLLDQRSRSYSQLPTPLPSWQCCWINDRGHTVSCQLHFQAVNVAGSMIAVIQSAANSTSKLAMLLDQRSQSYSQLPTPPPSWQCCWINNRSHTVSCQLHLQAMLLDQ